MLERTRSIPGGRILIRRGSGRTWSSVRSSPRRDAEAVAEDHEPKAHEELAGKVYDGIIDRSVRPLNSKEDAGRLAAGRQLAQESSKCPWGQLRTYSGRVELGEDLMVIEIGDEVVVRRRGASPPR